LKKQKAVLNLSEKAERIDFFEKEKNKVEIERLSILSLERDINKMVYQLYGLTEEEIQIVEKSI
jgi:hypothetical protein